MQLHIPTMDAVVLDVAPDGRVRLEGEQWTTPSLQERRAIIHAARNEIEQLEDLIAALEQAPATGPR